MINLKGKYGSRANAPSAEYPNGSFKNETSEGTNDGTPLDKLWGDDFNGFSERLLIEGGVAASGNPDTALSSDRFDAMKNIIAADVLAKPVSLENVSGNQNGNAIPDMNAYIDNLTPLSYSEIDANLASGAYNENDVLTLVNPPGPPFKVVPIGANVANGSTIRTGGALAAVRIYDDLIDPVWGGAPTDGTSDASIALNNVAAIGAVIIDRPYTITADVTFTYGVVFRGLGKITLSGTANLIVNDITGINGQIFVYSGTGVVTLNRKLADPTWFGAFPNLGDASIGGNRAIQAVGRAGTVRWPNQDIGGSGRYLLQSALVANFDELRIEGQQTRVRLQIMTDDQVIRQDDRMPEAYFGLELRNIDCFSKFAGTKSIIQLNRSFLFNLYNVYVDEGPSDGIELNGICAQGTLELCIVEECAGHGFREVSGAVQNTYLNCLAFSNGGNGFHSGGNTGTYDNALIGCKAWNNGGYGIFRNDAGVQLTACSGNHNVTAGIGLGPSAIGATASACVGKDTIGVPQQLYGFELSHYTQKVETSGTGNLTGLVFNNFSTPATVISSGAIVLPDVPDGTIITIGTEGGAASDNLDIIPRGRNGQTLILRPAVAGQNIVFRDEAGNLSLTGNLTTTSVKDILTLTFDITLNRWVQRGWSINGP